MNVLQINSIDERGGAAKMALRLAEGLRKKGVKTSELVGHRVGSDANIKEIGYPRQDVMRNNKFGLRGLLLPTLDTIEKDARYQQSDILQLHNLHLDPYGYFNIRNLPALCARKPTVWTLHDPWIMHEYGKTPEYDPYFQNMPRLFNWFKRSSIRTANLSFVVPSNWLKELVEEYYPNKPVKLIHHGIDTKIFRPISKASAKKKIGINAHEKVVLFVANEGEDNASKGIKYLKAVKASLEPEGIHFISLGSTSNKTYIHQESDLATYYSAADVFLLPSLAESFSLVALEAMACGTPTVAFRVGGISEIIEHQKDGYLARYKDQQDLMEGLRLMLNGQTAREFGRIGIKKVVREFTLSNMTNEYLKLYEEIS